MQSAKWSKMMGIQISLTRERPQEQTQPFLAIITPWLRSHWRLTEIRAPFERATWYGSTHSKHAIECFYMGSQQEPFLEYQHRRSHAKGAGSNHATLKHGSLEAVMRTPLSITGTLESISRSIQARIILRHVFHSAVKEKSYFD